VPQQWPGAGGPPVDELIEAAADFAEWSTLRCSHRCFSQKAVEAAHGSDDTDPRRRVLTAVARILPRRSGGFQDPLGPPEPALTGQALWARDAYGSRFAITAPFSSLDGTDRWYLWDVDACGLRALTVHSAHYGTSGAALDAWVDGVGESATAESVLAAIDDPGLAAALLTPEDGIMRLGGENEQQFAEFHRSRRRVEVLIDALGPFPDPSRPELDVERAAKQFSTWLRAHRTPPQGARRPGHRTGGLLVAGRAVRNMLTTPGGAGRVHDPGLLHRRVRRPADRSPPGSGRRPAPSTSPDGRSGIAGTAAGRGRATQPAKE
jgi:hypothetical protein